MNMRSVQQKGATLVELVITIVIVSIAIAGVVGAFSLIAGRSSDPLNQTRAVALAQLYYDEIAARYFDVNTPLGGGAVAATRVECSSLPGDNLTPRDATYPGFRVNVDISCGGDDSGIDLEPTQIKRIDITVIDPSGASYAFSAYRGNF